MKRIVVGISGASGVIYGIRLLEVLKETDYETHLIISEAGKMNIGIETGRSLDEVRELASFSYNDREIAAAPASGSFLTAGMVVAPCTIKTLSGIANSYNTGLLVRSADVTLKEQRKLVLMVRETPLHKGHLRLMSMAADNGAYLLPPVPAFYHRPRTLEDIIDQSIGKVLDYLEVPHQLFTRWDGSQKPKDL